ncbi:MAG: pyrroline-5-carboxylate reductase [Gemmatimonadota bacterium]
MDSESSSDAAERPDANERRIAILGGGNLGRALAEGWAAAGLARPRDIHITRRRPEHLRDLEARGFGVSADNHRAVEDSRLVILAVQPQQIEALAAEIRDALDADRNRVVSVVSGVPLSELGRLLGDDIAAIRAMPNTAVSIGESMTCLAGRPEFPELLDETRTLFDAVGRTMVIPEEMMIPATALCACGTAFFLRAVRAASQGGIEIGFHPEEALVMAAQTAKGAASLLLQAGSHPESEIDRVTTPRGCTIAGLNEMEHQGFSSALIKGILLSARMADELY